MTYILLAVIGFLVGMIIYLLSERNKDLDSLERYRAVVTEWTLYMHEKDNSRDFALWRKEFLE